MNPRGKSPLSFNRGARRGASTMYCIVYAICLTVPRINVILGPDIARSNNTVQSLNSSFLSILQCTVCTVITVFTGFEIKE